MRGATTELRVGGEWVNISDDVYRRDRIEISRGRPDEGSRTDPGKCALTLNNRAGKYSPRNPAGPYYGIIGRNTPLRVWVGTPPAGAGTAVDTDQGDPVVEHTAPSVDSRGDTGLLVCAWISYFASGDYTTPAGMTPGPETDGPDSTMATAVEALTASGDTGPRTATFTHGQFGYATATLAVPGETGPPVVEELLSDVRGNEPVQLMTGPGTQAGWWLVVVHAWDFDHPDTAPMRAPGGTPGEWLLVADSGTTDPPNAAPHVEVWARRVAAPGPQLVELADDDGPFVDFDNHGHVYVLSSVAFASPRITGEVSAWPVRWDTSEADVWVPVTAAGILRRLGQGAKALHSPIYRETLSPSKRAPRAYWPCEDNAGATVIASALGNGNPMTISGSPDLASFDGFAASDALPVMRDGTFVGEVADYTPTGETQVRCLARIDPASPDDERVFDFLTSGSATRWALVHSSGGFLALRAFAPNGANIFDSGFIGFDVDGKLERLSVELTQNGADVDWAIVDLEVGQTLGGQFGGTLAGHTVGTVHTVRIGPDGALGDSAVGHVTVYDQISSIFDLSPDPSQANSLAGWVGEHAGSRISRLCGEEQIAFVSVGDLGDTAALGPQQVDTLLRLLGDAADADGGILHETRSDIGLTYRTRRSLYNQGRP